MPRARDFNLSTFLSTVNPDLIERYLLRFVPEEQLPPRLVGMNPDYVEYVLRGNDTLKTAITEELRRINDACYRDLPREAARRYGVPAPDYETPQSTALGLFLDHSPVFDFAWALYSFNSAYAKISQHWLQVHDIPADSQAITNLRTELQSFFAGQARGDHCLVYVFDQPDEMVILVLHGSYLRTVAFWQGDSLKMNPFRFACDDVLIYDKAHAVLSVKAPARSDRQHYVPTFASLILGDAGLAENPERDKIYTFEPLQTRPSDWVGNGKVSAVELRKAKLKPFPGSSETRTVEGDSLPLTEVDSKHGELVEAKLRFIVTVDGREDKVTTTITPPCTTDLVKKRHAEIIVDYLREKGVLLR
jgi:hypothetical protein